MNPIIFTDLDGTLLDDKYSFNESLPALKIVKNKRIPLIFCTSKTEPEIKIYLKKMNINMPFIVENGGAVFIPKNYFNFRFKSNKFKDNHFVIELGTSYKKLEKIFNKIKKEIKFKIVGFSEMDAKSVAKDTGLKIGEARLAKKRSYSLPFKIEKNNTREIIKAVKKYKLNYTKGINYHYIMGKNDKAKAIKILTTLYKRKFKDVFTIGLGNGFNDLPMLKIVDKAYLIKNKDGYDKDIRNLRNIEKVRYRASKGWNKAILGFFKNDN
jgi:mannosyl-3-phosphoglycerate phosphatase|tara:strand:+ start:159 stop:962 length:804 start_codon:yes stop_codon:yes gene_type:complete